jgi:hypothetical protein
MSGENAVGLCMVNQVFYSEKLKFKPDGQNYDLVVIPGGVTNQLHLLDISVNGTF